MGAKGIFKFLGVRAFEGIVAIILVLVMPNLPPDANYQKSYTLDLVKPFEGKLALNDRLENVEIWHKGDLEGPEAFAEYNGELYTSVHGGDIVKLTGDHIIPVVKFGKPCKGLYQEEICGRPLGMTFDKNGVLYVADAYYGIYKVDVKTGEKVRLISMDDEINGIEPKLPNSVAVLDNGDIYWTDSSTEFDLQNGMFDILADGSGRFIHYNAQTKKNTVLLEELHFANGVFVSDDESFVIISETARSRIHRYYLKGPKKGTFDIFVSGLPGFTDNIQSDGKDGFLIPLVIPHDQEHPNPALIFGPFPLVRKFISRIFALIELGFKVANKIYPTEFAERSVHFIGHFTSTSVVLGSAGRCTIVHLSKTGEILDSLHSNNNRLASISDAFIYKNVLYLGSPFNNYIGRIPLEKAGLQHLMTDKSAQKVKTEKVVPVTQKPQTQEAPKTQKPPAREAPSTEKPVVKEVPVTKKPQVRETPQTQKPEVKQPPPTKTPQVKEAPSTQKPPVKEVPVTQKPPVKAVPVTQKPPVKEVPVTQKPQVKEVPVTQKPQVKEVPVTQKPPVKEVPVTQKPQVKEAPTTPKPQVKETPEPQKPQVKQAPPTPKPQVKEVPSSPTPKPQEAPRATKSAPETSKSSSKEAPPKVQVTKESPNVVPKN